MQLWSWHTTGIATVLPGWYCCVLWATDARFVQLSGLVRMCWSLPWNFHHLLLQYTKAKGWKLQKWMNVVSVVVMMHVGVTSLRWGFSSIPWWLSAYEVMNCSAGLWKFERMVKPFGTTEANYQFFVLFCFSTSYLVQYVGGKEPWSICHVSGCKVDIRGDADVQICMN